MKLEARATIDDLIGIEGKAEIIDGEIVPMAATGVECGFASNFIVLSLMDYVLRTGRGRPFGDNVGFRVDLPNRGSFSPDAAYVPDKPLGLGYYDGAPAFAAEIRSENDYGPAAEREMAAKRADYFAAGTLVVWDVDLLGVDVVRVYRADSPDVPTVYRRGDRAEAEPAVPGWSMAVDDFFRFRDERR